MLCMCADNQVLEVFFEYNVRHPALFYDSKLVCNYRFKLFNFNIISLDCNGYMFG
jgi:hypothetical protein